MLYLAICRSKAFPISPEFIDAFIKQCEYCGDLEQKGKVKFFAPFVGLNGGMAVLDVDSHEDAMKIIGGSPMLPFVEAEVIPLVDHDKARIIVSDMRS